MDRTVSPETLVRLADEIDRARVMVDGLADLVSGLVAVCSPTERPTVLIEIQAIDALNQHLEALAGFTRDLSSGRALHAAAATVPLAELAGRLADCRPPAACAPTALSGDLELFD